MNHTLLCATAINLALVIPVHAGTNEYTALLKADKFAEAERAAAARLTREPANADALIARSTAIAGGGAKARIPEAISYAERCVASHPGQAACHLILGKMLGWKAMAGGMMSAMAYAGDIRDAFKKAVELDPRNLDARFSLLQYYMLAPAIAGGGKGKAADLQAQTAALHPEAGKLMQATLEAHDGDLARAEALSSAVRPGTDEELRERHEAVLNTIVGKYVMSAKIVEADRAVQMALRHYPASEHVGYSLARVRQEQGRHRDALATLEPLAAKHGRAHVLYRLGQSQQALGDKPRATASLEKALAALPALAPKHKADVQARLSQLKG